MLQAEEQEDESMQRAEAVEGPDDLETETAAKESILLPPAAHAWILLMLG